MPKSSDETVLQSSDETVLKSDDEIMRGFERRYPFNIYSNANTYVFWDVEDYPIPNGLDPASIYQNIKEAIKKQGCLEEVSIQAYVDKNTLSDELQRNYADAGIKITFFPQVDLRQKADMSEEEVKSTLEAVASTGKIWQDLEKLKGMISFWLKVLSEYPEAKMTDDQQKEALGETYSELPFLVLMKALHLHCRGSVRFFWLQGASTQSSNLLVTSMLAISKDPQSETTVDPNAETADTKTAAANWAPNGIEAMGGDKDEIMTEVEEPDVDDAMTVDMETIDEPSETMTTTSESETPSENTAAQPSSDSMAAEEGDPRLP